MSLFGSKPVPVPETTSVLPPLSLEARHTSASLDSEYARSTFTDIVSDLQTANAQFLQVETGAAEEIARLQVLQADAAEQRAKNQSMINAIDGLLGA